MGDVRRPGRGDRTAGAFLVRTAWPLPALAVMSAALTVYGATGHEEEVLLALLVAVVTVGYRRSTTAALAGGVLASAPLTANAVASGEERLIVVPILLLKLMPAGTGVAARRIRRLRRLSAARDTLPGVGPGGVPVIDLTT